MKLFWSFARQEFQASTAYRIDFWFEIFSSIVSMYGVYWLWNILYRQQPQMFSISLPQMVTYAMLAMTLDTIFRPTNWVRRYINDQVSTGAIQMDLLRPLDFQFHLLARCTGLVIFSFFFVGLPAFLTGALLLNLQPPSSALDGLLFLVSLVPAYLVSFALNYLVGMISVYTLNARRIGWVYYAMLRFFSGQMVPLWIFPAFLAQVAAVLPFQSMVSIPLSLYIGRLTYPEAARALGLQVVWVAALLAICRLVWLHAHRKITVQGG